MHLNRVLHILNTAQPRGTGIAKIVRVLASHLSNEFCSEVWFVYDDGPLAQWFRDCGVEAKYVPWRPGIANLAGPLSLWLSARRNRFDLVHHHAADARVRGIVRNAMRAPILLHLHGRAAETAAPVPKQISTRFADRVIAVSRAVADFTQTPSDVVYSGVDCGPDDVRLQTGQQLVIGCAGRLVAIKGIDHLLRAFARMQDLPGPVRLEIAGDGPESDRLRRWAASLRIESAVSFLGWRQDIRELMRRWDVFVLPSLEEGLPYSLLEAMAEALPVVATAVGGVPEVVLDGETGFLVQSGDDQGMADRMVRLVSDVGLRAGMGKRGRERVRHAFAADSFATKIRSIYREILAARMS